MTIILDIGPDVEAKLTAMAQAKGLSAEQYAMQVMEQALASAGAGKPLATRIRERWAGMPAEIRAKLPEDGASQHDHYIYNVPRRPE